MASKQTEHYKLSQWEAADAVLRVDFKEDNAKIDAALHDLEEKKAEKTEVTALAAQLGQKMEKSENLWVKVGEVTASASAAELTVTVPNAEQYHRLMLSYFAKGPNTIWLSWNGGNACMLLSQSNTKLAAGQATLTAMYGGGALVCHEVYSQDSGGSAHSDAGRTYNGGTFSGAVVLGLKAGNGNFAAGTHLDVYGLKK